MGAYTRGTPINLVERFWLVDPLTEVATLTNPTSVRFTVHHPDDTTTSFDWPGDPGITNPSAGIFILHLAPQLPVGAYRYNAVASGAVVAESWGEFEILEDGVLPPAPSPVPFPGPCSPWISGDDVAAECDAGVGSDTWKLDTVAAAASSLLFSLSGRLFPGVCERTIRPCADTCGCWSRASGLSLASAAYPFFWRGGYWGDECGSRCGCGAESSILLTGIPVREVLTVKIDGSVLSPTSYRLEEGRWLLRLSDPGPPVVGHSWPSCQDMTLEDDQPGTFSIRYRWGIEPPELGRLAAAQMACELYKASTTGKCRLPSNVTRIVRQGITIDRVVAASSALRQGATGLAIVDAFLADVNPNGLTRRPAVYSPDVRRSRRSA